MGCSTSLLAASGDGYLATVMVVTADGSLLEYRGGITAADVIVLTGQEGVLCNSDKLFLNAYPLAAAPDEVLEPGQIYFLLSATELRRRLNGVTVAALAMRANSAMMRATEKQGRSRKIRVGPMGGVFDGEVGSDGVSLEWRPASRCLGGR